MISTTTTVQLEERAAALGITLPAPPTPQGAYLPAITHRGFVHTSGAGPMRDGHRHHCGYVGADVTVEQAREAAAIAAVNALASAISAVGGVEYLERLVKLTGYVRSAPGFVNQSAVVDGASTVLQGLLGEAGTHARTAVGVAELPFGICVEIELVVAHRTS